MSGKTIFSIPDTKFTKISKDPQGLESSLTQMRRVHPDLARTADETGIIIHGHKFQGQMDIHGDDFKSLEYLNLAESSCDKITFEGTFPELKHLDLSMTKLADIDFGTASFPKLEQLYLRQNQLTAFQLHSSMPKLALLDLGKNPFLQDINLATNLPALKFLYLYKKKEGKEDEKLNKPINQFSFLFLPSLKVLDLENGGLKSLPDNFLSLSGLETLYLTGNALNFGEAVIPEKERYNSLKTVFDYQKAFLHGSATNYRVKMLVVGNGRVGKTCLVNVLSGKECDPNEKSTEGIELEIGDLTADDLPSLKPDPLTLKVWDFGGQQIYHATHQFFLSKEAVYLVVWTHQSIADEYTKRDDITFDTKERSLDYWLDSVDRHAENSPIIIVGTHAQKIDLLDPLRGIDEKLIEAHQIKSIEVDSIEKTGFETLKTQIAKKIKGLDIFGRPIPQPFQKVIEKVLADKEAERREISREEFETYCSEAKVEEDAINTLVDIMVAGSYIIHFYDKNDSDKLTSTIFIDLEWLTEEVYKLFNKGLETEKGKFDNSYLQKIFTTDDGYGQMRRSKLIELLKKFDLIFQVDENDESYYIAPQYLPEFGELDEFVQKTINDEDDKLKAGFVLKYANFIPDNVIINFLSKYGPFATKSYWIDGIFFNKSVQNTKVGCLVKLNEAEQKLIVKTEDTKLGQELQNEICHQIAALSGNAKLHVSVDGGQVFVDWQELMGYFGGLKEMRVEKMENQHIQDVDRRPVSINPFLHLLDKKQSHQKSLSKYEQQIREIQDFVVIDKMDSAFAKLREYLPEESDTIILLQKRWNTLDKDKRRHGVTDTIRHDMEVVSGEVLALAKKIKTISLEQKPPKPPSPVVTIHDAPKWYQLWWVGRIGIALVSSLFIGYFVNKYISFPFWDSWLGAFGLIAALLLLRNPEKRYFRLASGIFGSVGVINVLPFIDLGADGVSKTGKWYFKLGIQDQPWITALLILAGLFALVLDFKWRSRKK